MLALCVAPGNDLEDVKVHTKAQRRHKLLVREGVLGLLGEVHQTAGMSDQARPDEFPHHHRQIRGDGLRSADSGGAQCEEWGAGWGGRDQGWSPEWRQV